MNESIDLQGLGELIASIGAVLTVLVLIENPTVAVVLTFHILTIIGITLMIVGNRRQ